MVSENWFLALGVPRISAVYSVFFDMNQFQSDLHEQLNEVKEKWW